MISSMGKELFVIFIAILKKVYNKYINKDR